MRYLIFCFDGTQNGLDDEFPTNIRIISELADIPGQKVFYFEGPGNDEGDIFEHLLGSAFGYGMRETVDDAIDILAAEFTDADKIAVFGFSRGAAEARKFSAQIAQKGYATEFLGVFDTVFAMLPFGPFQQDSFFNDLHVSGLVKNARHAVARHEDRKAFAPNLMNARPGIVEMWFHGNHADVGGGYKDRGLADISLRWMIEEATQCGLQFGSMDVPALPNEVHRERLPLRRKDREIGVMRDGEFTDEVALLHPTGK